MSYWFVLWFYFLILLTFIESLKIILINMVTPEFRKIKVFWKISYDVMISTNDVTNKTFSRNSNYILDVVMWPKYGKRIKTKSQKVLGANCYVCRSYRGKTGRGPFCPLPTPHLPPSWIGLREIHTLRANNLIVSKIKNGKFLGYYFYTNTNIQADFQIYISVPWKLFFVRFF